ncbi:MAG TPA: hypothetical protein VH087_20845, partial [Thermoanaerobaculia bacterium]|nr:hypothetical protein [Thermoanaerobaculia bacterium]
MAAVNGHTADRNVCAPQELGLRVRGVGRGIAATIAGRGVDVLATYLFYAIVARSIPVSEFGRFVLAFTILQTAAASARVGLDQALLAVEVNGATNRFGLQVVLATSIGFAAMALIFVRVLPPFGIWLIAAFPCVVGGQYVAAALRASGNVSIAAIAESVVQPAAAAAGAIAATVYAPSASSYAIAFLVSWLLTLLFAPLIAWRGGAVDRGALLRSGRSMLGVAML